MKSIRGYWFKSEGVEFALVRSSPVVHFEVCMDFLFCVFWMLSLAFSFFDFLGG